MGVAVAPLLAAAKGASEAKSPDSVVHRFRIGLILVLSLALTLPLAPAAADDSPRTTVIEVGDFGGDMWVDAMQAFSRARTLTPGEMAELVAVMPTAEVPWNELVGIASEEDLSAMESLLVPLHDERIVLPLADSSAIVVDVEFDATWARTRVAYLSPNEEVKILSDAIATGTPDGTIEVTLTDYKGAVSRREIDAGPECEFACAVVTSAAGTGVNSACGTLAAAAVIEPTPVGEVIAGVACAVGGIIISIASNRACTETLCETPSLIPAIVKIESFSCTPFDCRLTATGYDPQGSTSAFVRMQWYAFNGDSSHYGARTTSTTGIRADNLVKFTVTLSRPSQSACADLASSDIIFAGTGDSAITFHPGAGNSFVCP